jgi:hypothetical protein
METNSLRKVAFFIKPEERSFLKQWSSISRVTALKKQKIRSPVHLKLRLPHLHKQLYNTALPRRLSGPFDTFHIAQYEGYPIHNRFSTPCQAVQVPPTSDTALVQLTNCMQPIFSSSYTTAHLRNKSCSYGNQRFIIGSRKTTLSLLSPVDAPIHQNPP